MNVIKFPKNDYYYAREMFRAAEAKGVEDGPGVVDRFLKNLREVIMHEPKFKHLTTNENITFMIEKECRKRYKHWGK